MGVKRVKRYTKSLTALVPESIYEIIMKKAQEREATISEITRELILYAVSTLGWDKEIKKEEQFNLIWGQSHER